MFFSLEKELFIWTYLMKKTPRRTKILTSPVWNKILKIWDIPFELIQIEVRYSRNYFNFFYHKKLELLKRTAKATPKIEKYVHYIFTENICSDCNPMQVVVCKFSHLKVTQILNPSVANLIKLLKHYQDILAFIENSYIFIIIKK